MTSSINKFFQWIAEKSGDVAHFISDSDKNNDKYVNKHEARSYFEGNLNWKGNFTESEFNQFWNKIDTLQNENNVSGTKNKNLYTLDNNELAAMEKNVQAFGLINDFLNTLQVPAGMAGIVSAAALRSKVSESLQNVVSNYISTNNNIDMEELEQLIQTEGNTAMIKSCADLYANGYFAKEIAKYKNELSGYSSDNDANWTTMINTFVNSEGLTIDSIVSTVQSLVSAYLATAKLGNGSADVNLLKQYGYDDSSMNGLQTTVITNKIRTALGVDSATYKNYKEKFDEYVGRFIQDMLNSGKTFDELYSMNDLAEQFRNSNYGVALNTLLTYSELDPYTETTDALDGDNNNGNSGKRPFIDFGDGDLPDLGDGWGHKPFKPTTPGRLTTGNENDDSNNNGNNGGILTGDNRWDFNLDEFKKPLTDGSTIGRVTDSDEDDSDNNSNNGGITRDKDNPFTDLDDGLIVGDLKPFVSATENTTTSVTKKSGVTQKSEITDNRNTSSFYSSIYDALLAEFNNDKDKATAYAENIYKLSRTNGSAYKQIVEQVADMIADGDLGTSPSSTKIEAKIIDLIIANVDKFAPATTTTTTSTDDGNNETPSTDDNNNNDTSNTSVSTASSTLSNIFPDTLNSGDNEFATAAFSGMNITNDTKLWTNFYIDSNGEIKFYFGDVDETSSSNDNILDTAQVYSQLKDKIKTKIALNPEYREALDNLGGEEVLDKLIQAAWIASYNANSSSEGHTPETFINSTLRNLHSILASISEHPEYLSVYTAHTSLSDTSLTDGLEDNWGYSYKSIKYDCDGDSWTLNHQTGEVTFTNKKYGEEHSNAYNSIMNELLEELKAKYSELDSSVIERIFNEAKYEALHTMQTNENDCPIGCGNGEYAISRKKDGGKASMKVIVQMTLYSFDKLLYRDLAGLGDYQNVSGYNNGKTWA